MTNLILGEVVNPSFWKDIPRDGNFAGNLEDIALKMDFTCTNTISVHEGLGSVTSLETEYGEGQL